MGYEIYEQRLVARDGYVAQEEKVRHGAVVSGEDGELRLKLSALDPDVLMVRQSGGDTEGFMVVWVAEVIASVTALRRLRGVEWAGETQETVELRERAATVVERACGVLEDNADPTQATLASDLRATMLQLIDLATRPAGVA
jgi:hypothetical protein